MVGVGMVVGVGVCVPLGRRRDSVIEFSQVFFLYRMRSNAFKFFGGEVEDSDSAVR